MFNLIQKTSYSSTCETLFSGTLECKYCNNEDDFTPTPCRGPNACLILIQLLYILPNPHSPRKTIISILPGSKPNRGEI